MRGVMLTTIDNPYDPYDQWDKWLIWDTKHYGTCEYLARVADISDDMSQSEQIKRMNEAKQEIVLVNPLGVHILV